jgi:hypothetical protein
MKPRGAKRRSINKPVRRSGTGCYGLFLSLLIFYPYFYFISFSKYLATINTFMIIIVKCFIKKCMPSFYFRPISSNVPVVYDVLAARIEKCVAFLGPTKCGGVLAWEWSEAK